MTLLGLPISRWLFALRIWIAVMLALGVAFWLELDSASSAGVCVVILALQTRGQVFDKAIYRMLGTIVGAVVAIAITGVFVQERDLYVIACSLWLGLCVFAAGFLDGNRAYGAVLSGYTMSIIAMERIDTPDQVFSAATDRVAAIAIGIAAMSFINITFAAPDITPALVQSLRGIQARVHAFVDNPTSTDAEAAQILGTINDRHPEITTLSLETTAGSRRVGAVRATLAGLVGKVVTTRQLANVQNQQLRAVLSTYQSAEEDAFRALELGQKVPGAPRMPIYRPWENAFRNALRAFLASTLTGFGLVLTGWSATDLTWTFVAIVVCLSATVPDPRAVARAAVIAMPASVVLAGITEFDILDGSDSFPLLCTGLAPVVVGGSLLISSPLPKQAIIGTLLTVFTLVVIRPSNPQTYDPSAYVMTGMLMVLATVLVYVFLHVLWPVTDQDRRIWVLRSARRALWSALRGRFPRPQAEARILDVSRVGALSALKDASTQQQAADLATLFWLTDLRDVVQRVWSGLDQLRLAASLRGSVQAALCQSDAIMLRQMASDLLLNEQPSAHIVAGDITLAARLVELGLEREAAR